MMSVFKKELKHEMRRIQRLIELTAPEISAEELGFLEVRRVRKQKYYYQSVKKDGKRKKVYLGKADNPKLKAYLGEHFKIKRLKILHEDLHLIEDFLKAYKDYEAETVWKEMSLRACDLPAMESVDRRYEEIRAWANEECESNPADMPERKNYAKDGTEVRSKAECILYNILLDLGIPFRYDKEFIVIDQYGREKKVYPDFQILCYDGTLLILEHLGMLLKYEYASKNIIRIQDYIRSGFIIGKDLILTSESAEGGTDSEMLAEIAEWIADRFYR